MSPINVSLPGAPAAGQVSYPDGLITIGVVTS
jgi:hypothetical protein